MKVFICFYLIPMILSLPFKDNEDCWINHNKTITNKYAVLVNFALNSDEDSCSVQIVNPWSEEMQNGFGVFLRQAIDCSSTVTIECLPGSIFLKQAIPSTVQYTCHTSLNKVEMPCSLIGLTFKRNHTIQETNKSTNVQIVALAKEPCMDRDILFQCPQDYSHSCIDRKLHCNGRSECLSGDDERNCHDPSLAGITMIGIILGILVFLLFLCILSTVFICCCCREACNMIIHRFHSAKKNRSIEKGEIAVVTGEDAGLIKGLTTPNVIEVLPQQHTEPATLIIDSTKPVYPRLE